MARPEAAPHRYARALADWGAGVPGGGAIFLLYYFQDGLLSRGSAFNAGFGDVLTRLLALPVAGAAKRRVRHHREFALAWNLFGILDLIVAPASAVYFGAKGQGAYPLLLIPLFLGPPLGTLLHICSLRNLALSSRETISVAIVKTARVGEIKPRLVIRSCYIP